MVGKMARSSGSLKAVLTMAFLCVPLMLFPGHRQSSFSTLMYNDSLTLGLAENQDDLRSFGMDFQYLDRSSWFGRSMLSGVTWRSRGVEETGSRYDELVVEGGYSFHFHLNDQMPAISIVVSPVFGVVLAGNMGFEAVQNLVHDSFLIEELALPYEYEGISLYPRMGFEQSFDYVESAPWFSVSDLVFRTDAKGFYMPGYAGRFYAGFLVGHRTQASSEFMVGLGYGWKHVEDGWTSHEMVGKAETGLTASVTGHFGMLAFSYRWYLETLQGFGGMGFDIGFGGKGVWRQNDLLLSLGVVVPWNMLTTSLRYRISGDFGVVVSNSFKMIPLEVEDRVRENISSWHVGVDYEVSQWEIGFMRPFAMSGMGIRRILVMRDAAPDDFDSNGRVRELETVRFSMIGAVGLRFLPEGQVQYDGVAYGLEISAGVVFADTAKLESGYDLELTDTWAPYVKIGFTVGSHL